MQVGEPAQEPCEPRRVRRYGKEWSARRATQVRVAAFEFRLRS